MRKKQRRNVKFSNSVLDLYFLVGNKLVINWFYFLYWKVVRNMYISL